MSAAQGTHAIEAASAAYGRGRGDWPTRSLAARIAAIEAYLEALQAVRSEIITLLMWEICKNTADATKEFDRTMDFVRDVITVLKAAPAAEPFADWTTLGGVAGKVRRGPVGVCLMVAAFNYPFNELYAMLIPALLMGNTVALKLPTIGGLSHILTIDALAKTLPKGVVNFVTGSGRSTLPPIMNSGLVDMIGYIGGRHGIDALCKAHPEPHRLKVYSQLEGNNMAVVTPSADVSVAVKQIVSGTTSYNGQRCTAIKLVVVHESIAEAFVAAYVEAINALEVGLPWETGTSITPLPDEHKPDYLGELVTDALAKGAKVVAGGSKHFTLVQPTVLYPVTAEARAFSEEQFGPVIPIATYKTLDFVLDEAAKSWNGQQVAIFCDAQDPAAAAIVDGMQAIMGRINLNTAPSRGPDQFPFSGRRSSALGTMSVTRAIDAFSIETIVAYKDNDANKAIAAKLDADTAFFKPVA
mmetsp:Transcript_12746/g.51191  ORF Transcript_12746/g.51191 Transcript_12746/m.51191 type:complete len:469 (-) Transcript_12746:270-1676(-)